MKSLAIFSIGQSINLPKNPNKRTGCGYMHPDDDIVIFQDLSWNVAILSIYLASLQKNLREEKLVVVHYTTWKRKNTMLASLVYF